jgi:membrane protease YdiL (CAAX protease family)
MINTPVKHLEERMSTTSPRRQFLIFTGVFLGVFIIGNIIALAVVSGLYGTNIFGAFTTMNPATPHLISAIWILQTVGTTLTIFVAAIVFAKFVVREPKGYLKTSLKFPWVLLVLIFAIAFISTPLIEFLTNLNQKIPLPHWLEWMKDNKANQKVMSAMLNMKNIGNLIFDLVLIALFTAVVEEFMFRGVLQTIFFRWTKSIHAAVWITAILFSAFHLEFYGFLPRVMLGVLFGYFVAWSGSIWTSVWAHFLNNGTIVVVTYLFQHKIIKLDPDDQHVFTGASYLFCLALVLFLLYLYQKTAFEKSQTPESDGEELG